MSTTPSYAYGTFTWREIMTPDVAASKRFYGEVFGWKFDDMPMDGFTYTLIKNGGASIGGVFPLNPSTGAPPHWIGTLSVADVDASAKVAADAGGTVAMPPGDIPGYGRFAVVLDPLGAPLTLMHNFNGDPAPTGRPGLGDFCWEHLNTSDVAASKAFLGKLCGWEATAMPAGMEVFTVGEKQVASFSANPPGVPTHWLTYVVVDQLASARARVISHGGKVVMEEIPVPGIGSFAVVTDNVGATVCLFQAQG